MAGERSEERLVYLCDLPEAKRLLRAGIERCKSQGDPVPSVKFHLYPAMLWTTITVSLFILYAGVDTTLKVRDFMPLVTSLLMIIGFVSISTVIGEDISSPRILAFIRNEFRVAQLDRLVRLRNELEKEETLLKSMEFRLAQARLRLEHGPQNSRSDLEPELSRREHFFKHQLEAVRQDREQLEELSVWTRAYVEFTFAPTLGKSNDEVLSEARRITAEVSSSLNSLSNRRIDLTDSSTSASDLLKSLETRLATRQREEREVEVTLTDNAIESKGKS